jgi:hypothetical protein
VRPFLAKRLRVPCTSYARCTFTSHSVYQTTPDSGWLGCCYAARPPLAFSSQRVPATRPPTFPPPSQQLLASVVRAAHGAPAAPRCSTKSTISSAIRSTTTRTYTSPSRVTLATTRRPSCQHRYGRPSRPSGRGERYPAGTSDLRTWWLATRMRCMAEWCNTTGRWNLRRKFC